MRQTSWLLAAAASLGLLSTAAACKTGNSSALPMQPNPATASASGSISTSVDHNGNTELTVKVDHLPPAASLVPYATNYVVWIVPVERAPQGTEPAGPGPQPQTWQMNPPNRQTSGQNPLEPRGQNPSEIGPAPGEHVGPAINAGALRLGSDQHGKLKTKTPFAEFEVLITPERSPVALQPSNSPVLVARVESR